jgi:GntR family transcriptional regulator
VSSLSWSLSPGISRNQKGGRYRHADRQDQPAQAPFSLTLLCLPEEKVGIGRIWLIRSSSGRWWTLDNSHNATIIGVMASVKATRESESDALILTEVDRSDPLPLHDQVAAEIRRAIAEGEADPGDRIPQAKDLAAVLGVNTNTVLRALRVLRDEGLLELGRGRAIVVAGTPERSAVVARMKEFLDFARSQGYRRDEVLTMMESLP